MKITKDLKLAFSVETTTHGTVLIYSPSITRETFELYFKELGKVFAECYADDDEGRHLALVGPQIAYSSLKAAAKALGTWDTPSGVENGFINELMRLTQIAYADKAGWKKIPMATALAHGVLDDDATEEVLNSLVFFTAACKAGPRKLASTLLPVVAQSLDWAIGSWTDFSAYIDSLPKSTPAATSETQQQSVIA